MCLAFKEQTSKVIFRFVVPFANRLADLRLADRLANWPDWQIVQNISKSIGKRVPWQHGQERYFLGIKHHGKMQHLFFGPTIKQYKWPPCRSIRATLAVSRSCQLSVTAHPLGSLHARTVTTNPSCSLLAP